MYSISSSHSSIQMSQVVVIVSLLLPGVFYFTKKLKDGENFRIFEDTAYDPNPKIIGNKREPHAALAYSDEGTVCLNHLYRDELMGCTNCCEATCLSLNNPDEIHTVYYRYNDGNRWFVEMQFSKTGSGGSSNEGSSNEGSNGGESRVENILLDPNHSVFHINI